MDAHPPFSLDLDFASNAVVQIGNIKVDVNDAGTRPIVFDKSVNPSVQRPVMDNDHEASSSNSTSK